VFDLALDAAPDWSQAAAAKALAYFLADEYARALSQARRALRMNPGDPEMLDLIRDAAHKLDRDVDAFREMELELSRDPEVAARMVLKGSIFVGSQRL